jgi:hypothetical protein
MSLGLFVVISAVVVLACAVSFIWFMAKKDVDDVRKVPMLLCDKHGMYPESAAFEFTATAIGRKDLVSKQCPFCYDERMTQFEEELKK